MNSLNSFFCFHVGILYLIFFSSFCRIGIIMIFENKYCPLHYYKLFIYVKNLSNRSIQIIRPYIRFTNFCSCWSIQLINVFFDSYLNYYTSLSFCTARKSHIVKLNWNQYCNVKTSKSLLISYFDWIISIIILIQVYIYIL